MSCPICADDYDWPDDSRVWVFDEQNARYDVEDTARLSEAKRASLARKGYRLCPNPSDDMEEHYLPATYAEYDAPLVVGLVGAPFSGKTHLLTAMIRQANKEGLAAYGIDVSALDLRRHDYFRQNFVKPFEKGGTLPGTSSGIIEAADILLLRGRDGRQRPVTFFDAAGEDLESTEARNRATRFLLSANAVIFVHAWEDPLETGESSPESENKSFQLAVESLRALPHGEQVPAVIAVTKSDRLRYVPPVDRWLHRGDERVLDAARMREESRDVYAYLHHVGAGASLRPFTAFTRCTLHFVSASGGDAVPVTSGDGQDRHFPRGFRPTRVLEPLVAILAMTGMITGPEAEQVGRP
ncbi:TRAFAC clade GTPase domain-containing protein [Saccharothrix sp. Mg75]|uniref:TRAFAC clade GTPase domain-containing protein n=1 Tax=Saccharothrix sp. Mg75 TaxID=3445357 RepID=UPI003EED33C2